MPEATQGFRRVRRFEPFQNPTEQRTMSAVVGQAHVVDVLLAERRVVDDLLVRLGDDISGHEGRHDGRQRRSVERKRDENTTGMVCSGPNRRLYRLHNGANLRR